MKTSRSLFTCAALTWCLAFLPAGHAQETPKAEEKAAPPPAPAPAEAPATPPPADGKAGELRRIDGDANATPDSGGRRNRPTRVHLNSGHGNPRISIGDDTHVAKGEHAEAVVSIFGSSTSEGEVDEAVVSILGNTRATGPVGEAAVSVLGSTYVNSKVGDNVVAVMGDVELGPDAEVGGDVVAVGGKITRDPKSVVRGDVHTVSVGPRFAMGHGAEWLRAWFRDCLLYGRMLWVGPHLMWAWAVAGIALMFYIILALLFRGGVEKGVATFETRPGSSILASILAMLLSPVLIVLLCVTVVGIALVPFLGTALLIAVLFGKAIMLAWLGRRITKFFGDGPLNHPAFAVLVGGLIVMGLYMIPVVGLITYKVLKVLGLGVVVFMVVNSNKREKPAAVVAAPAGVAPAAAMGVVAGGATVMAAAPVSAEPPVVVPASTLPRAGFWIRMGALLIDTILIGILVSFITGLMYRWARPDGPQGFLLGIAAYGAIMWKLKGTTIGGIVCGLKVVRLDGRPVDWATAIVRALSCFLSMIVAGLGFIWVVIDDDKQSWHDKIAGTTVVRVPKGMALV